MFSRSQCGRCARRGHAGGQHGALGVFLGVVALAVVALLIGGFLLSKRKHDAEPPPPQPHEQPPKPERRTHIEQTDPHSSDRFPGRAPPSRRTS
ncbi:hypothetical protein SCYAM73S_07797 [Streptomyces cyaneofuscatus]